MSKPTDLIILADKVVTSHGFSDRPAKGSDLGEIKVIEDGAVAVVADVITAVGPRREVLDGISLSGKEKIIDARGQVCLPGFVDPHTHTVFGGSREDEFVLRITGTTYMEILEGGGGILDTVRATKAMSYEELLAKTRLHLDRIIEGGTTTLEIKSGYGLDFETEIKMLEVMAQLQKEHPVDIVPTFLGAHALPPEYSGRPDEFIDFIIEDVLPYIAEKELAEYCDVFCEKGVFDIEQSRRLLAAAKELGFGIRLHADEMVSIGGAELAAELGAHSADHLLEASSEGIKKMAEQNVIATLLPATPFTLMKGKYAPARDMINNSVAVALASDFNPGSSPTHSMALVMTLACLKLKLTPEEALNGVTINAAHSIGRSREVGSIEVGKKADLVIFDAPNHRYIPYHFGVSLVDKVIKGGRLVVERGKLLVNAST